MRDESHAADFSHRRKSSRNSRLRQVRSSIDGLSERLSEGPISPIALDDNDLDFPMPPAKVPLASLQPPSSASMRYAASDGPFSADTEASWAHSHSSSEADGDGPQTPLTPVSANVTSTRGSRSESKSRFSAFTGKSKAAVTSGAPLPSASVAASPSRYASTSEGAQNGEAPDGSLVGNNSRDSEKRAWRPRELQLVDRKKKKPKQPPAAADFRATSAGQEKGVTGLGLGLGLDLPRIPSSLVMDPSQRSASSPGDTRASASDRAELPSTHKGGSVTPELGNEKSRVPRGLRRLALATGGASALKSTGSRFFRRQMDTSDRPREGNSSQSPQDAQSSTLSTPPLPRWPLAFSRQSPSGTSDKIGRHSPNPSFVSANSSPNLPSGGTPRLPSGRQSPLPILPPTPTFVNRPSRRTSAAESFARAAGHHGGVAAPDSESHGSDAKENLRDSVESIGPEHRAEVPPEAASLLLGAQDVVDEDQVPEKSITRARSGSLGSRRRKAAPAPLILLSNGHTLEEHEEQKGHAPDSEESAQPQLEDADVGSVAETKQPGTLLAVAPAPASAMHSPAMSEAAFHTPTYAPFDEIEVPPSGAGTDAKQPEDHRTSTPLLTAPVQTAAAEVDPPSSPSDYGDGAEESADPVPMIFRQSRPQIRSSTPHETPTVPDDGDCPLPSISSMGSMSSTVGGSLSASQSFGSVGSAAPAEVGTASTTMDESVEMLADTVDPEQVGGGRRPSSSCKPLKAFGHMSGGGLVPSQSGWTEKSVDSGLGSLTAEDLQMGDGSGEMSDGPFTFAQPPARAGPWADLVGGENENEYSANTTNAADETPKIGAFENTSNVSESGTAPGALTTLLDIATNGSEEVGDQRESAADVGAPNLDESGEIINMASAFSNPEGTGRGLQANEQESSNETPVDRSTEDDASLEVSGEGSHPTTPVFDTTIFRESPKRQSETFETERNVAPTDRPVLPQRSYSKRPTQAPPVYQESYQPATAPFQRPSSQLYMVPLFNQSLDAPSMPWQAARPSSPVPSLRTAPEPEPSHPEATTPRSYNLELQGSLEDGKSPFIPVLPKSAPLPQGPFSPAAMPTSTDRKDGQRAKKGDERDAPASRWSSGSESEGEAAMVKRGSSKGRRSASKKRSNSTTHSARNSIASQAGGTAGVTGTPLNLPQLPKGKSFLQAFGLRKKSMPNLRDATGAMAAGRLPASPMPMPSSDSPALARGQNAHEFPFPGMLPGQRPDSAASGTVNSATPDPRDPSSNFAQPNVDSSSSAGRTRSRLSMKRSISSLRTEWDSKSKGGTSKSPLGTISPFQILGPKLGAHSGMMSPPTSPPLFEESPEKHQRSATQVALSNITTESARDSESADSDLHDSLRQQSADSVRESSLLSPVPIDDRPALEDNSNLTPRMSQVALNSADRQSEGQDVAGAEGVGASTSGPPAAARAPRRQSKARKADRISKQEETRPRYPSFTAEGLAWLQEHPDEPLNAAKGPELAQVAAGGSRGSASVQNDSVAGLDKDTSGSRSARSRSGALGVGLHALSTQFGDGSESDSDDERYGKGESYDDTAADASTSGSEGSEDDYGQDGAEPRPGLEKTSDSSNPAFAPSKLSTSTQRQPSSSVDHDQLTRRLSRLQTKQAGGSSHAPGPSSSGSGHPQSSVKSPSHSLTEEQAAARAERIDRARSLANRLKPQASSNVTATGRVRRGSDAGQRRHPTLELPPIHTMPRPPPDASSAAATTTSPYSAQRAGETTSPPPLPPMKDASMPVSQLWYNRARRPTNAFPSSSAGPISVSRQGSSSEASGPADTSGERMQTQSAVQSTQEMHVYIAGRHMPTRCTVPLTARAKDVVQRLMEREDLQMVPGRGGWALFDFSSRSGIERPLREYEVVASVAASRPSASQDAAFYWTLKQTELSSLLSIRAVPVQLSALAGNVYVRDRRGKWNKRWLELRDDGGVFQAKSDKGKDEVPMCNLSDWDVYLSDANVVKAPKAHCFALRRQSQSGTLPNNDESEEGGILHFSTSDPAAHRDWIRALTNGRTWLLRRQQPQLFTDFVGIRGGDLTRPSRPSRGRSSNSYDGSGPTLPQTVPPQGNATLIQGQGQKDEPFAKGSLLAKQLSRERGDR